MLTTRLLYDSISFNNEFNRCCDEYKSVDLAVAWLGNPQHTLPYKQLERFGPDLHATIGVSFAQTHPDGIEWLEKIGAELRIFRNKKDELFHPKIYLFSKNKNFALFLGSSNLTYSGFYKNIEANVLIEGSSNSQDVDIAALQRTLNNWRSDENSFSPTRFWMEEYRNLYWSTIEKAHVNEINIPPIEEEDLPSASWLSEADWNVYKAKIYEGLRSTGRTADSYLDLLSDARDALPLPWHFSIFHELNNRRIIGGMRPYGWLGHVAASGAFREMMAEKKNVSTHQKIVNSINKIAVMESPLNWSNLEAHLDGLTALGPTMKVWSRLLCLARPDMYCTVASPSVRNKMSKVLGIPQSSIETSSGYIRILRLIHQAPWFHSQKPNNSEEFAIWASKVALMDAIFYE